MCGFCLQCSESVKPLNLNLSMQARDSRQDRTRRASSVEVARRNPLSSYRYFEPTLYI